MPELLPMHSPLKHFTLQNKSSFVVVGILFGDTRPSCGISIYRIMWFAKKFQLPLHSQSIPWVAPTPFLGTALLTKPGNRTYFRSSTTKPQLSPWFHLFSLRSGLFLHSSLLPPFHRSLVSVDTMTASPMTSRSLNVKRPCSQKQDYPLVFAMNTVVVLHALDLLAADVAATTVHGSARMASIV